MSKHGNLSDRMKMRLGDIIKKNELHQVGGKNRDRDTSPGWSHKGGALRSDVSRMPANGGGVGCGVIRDRSRGSISRHRSVGGSHRFSALSTDRNIGHGDATKLIITNLDYGVMDRDIFQLFSVFGPLKKAAVNYDRSNRSLGSADVIFEKSSDAIKALKEYNGQILDGCEMNIRLTISEMPDIKPARAVGFRRSSSRPGRNRSGDNRCTKSGGRGPADKCSAGTGRKSAEGVAAGGKMARGKRAQKKVVTAEQLDAELDEYLQRIISSSSGDKA